MAISNLKKIKQDFDDVIKYTQSIPDPKTDKLFDVWMECKRDFIELFNGEFIYIHKFIITVLLIIPRKSFFCTRC